MAIARAPPTPEGLEQSRARLSELMHKLTVDLMHLQADLLRAADTSELRQSSCSPPIGSPKRARVGPRCPALLENHGGSRLADPSAPELPEYPR